MSEVWVVTTHHGHGESTSVFGVFNSFESAREALKAQYPQMKVYGETGILHGRPKKDDYVIGPRYESRMYAEGRPYGVSVTSRDPL